ncbi:MAG: hypothetical protein ACP5H6_09125, partial [Caldivirga sp.]
MSNKSGKYGTAKLLPVLAIALALVIVGLGHAVKAISLPGPPVPPTVKIVNQTFTISLNLAYAQPPLNYLTTTYNSTIEGMYHLLYDTVPAYYGIAGQSITFYIVNASDITYPNGTLVPGSYLDYFNTAISSDIGMLIGESFTVTTNSTGGFTSSFQLPVSPSSLNYSSFNATWMVIVTLNYKGYQWVIFNLTTAKYVLLGSLLNNLTNAASNPTGSFLTVGPNHQQYQIMVKVNGTTGSYYAMPMTGLNVIYIWFGLDLSTSAQAAAVSSSLFSKLALTFAEYFNGTPIIVNSSLSYNPTATQFSTGIYGVQYVAFGPIIYLPALIFQNGHLLGFAQCGSSNPTYFTINVTYSYYNPGTQSIVSVPIYATTNYASAGYYNGSLLLGGVLTSYDFHYDAFFYITSLDGYGYGVVAPHYEGLPDLVIAGGLITINASGIYDIKGNLIANLTYVFSPTASLLFEITTGPQYSQILYGPLPISFLFQGFTIPAVKFTGLSYWCSSSSTGHSVPSATPLSPAHMAMSIELQTTSGTWDVAFLNLSALINLAINNNTPDVTIQKVYVSLLPTVLAVTTYTPGVTATSQEPLPVEKAEQIKALLYSGPSISGLSLVTTGQVILYNSTYTVAVFPSLQVVNIVNGYLAQSPVVELPVPTFTGTFVSGTSKNGALTITSPVYFNTTSTLYYNLQLYYGTIMVGSGVFAATYNFTKTPTTWPTSGGLAPAVESGHSVYPLFSAYYANGANNTLYAVGSEAFIKTALMGYYSELAYTAVHITLYKVEFVNLCNQTITQGIVQVTTPYGTFNISLAFAYPYTILQYPVQVNMWNIPVAQVTPTASFKLFYFGYVMPPVNPFTRQAITTPITLQSTVVYLVYFPLIDVVFQVVTPVTTPATPLPGFVVAAYSSVTGQKMFEGISNGTTEYVANGYIVGFQLPAPNANTGLPNYGTVLIMNVPINASYIMPNSYFALRVRTISPSVESTWTYNYYQYLWNQTYSQYSAWLGLPSGVTAYTFGTRGQIDEGLTVYYNATYSIPVNTSCYYTFLLPVYVENLQVYVVDSQNNVLANQLVYPASLLPGAAVWMNTTLAIYDAYSPYAGASVWYQYPSDAWNLTFFGIMGIAGAKPLYTRLAGVFYNLTSIALGEGLYSDVLNNQSYLLTAVYLANASSSSPYAIFKIPSYPYGKASEGYLARLFMPGQVFYGKAFYLGYEVFSGNLIVPPPGMITLVYANGTIKYVSSYTVYVGGQAVSVPPNSIVIVSSVYPTLISVKSKSLGYNVPNTVIALTFYDSLFKVLVPSNTVPSSVVSWAKSYLGTILAPFETISKAYTI